MKMYLVLPPCSPFFLLSSFSYTCYTALISSFSHPFPLPLLPRQKTEKGGKEGRKKHLALFFFLGFAPFLILVERVPLLSSPILESGRNLLPASSTALSSPFLLLWPGVNHFSRGR